MQLLTARRRAFSALTALTVTAALAGCGGDDKSTGGGGGSASSGNDGAALLKDGFLNVALGGETIQSGSFALKVSGSVDLPEDDEIKKIDGTASITGSVDKNTDKGPLPPMTVTFDVDGSYVDGKSKEGKGAYKGGVTYVGNSFYANWDGTNFAVGTELSKQLLDEIG
ncbi:MAG: hypothetical protein Q7T55_10050, partial [Solirubrobacteraceae bacterium]|nr:hypothetical protein [Solirubrobacteraceae bacterium]